MSKRYKSSKTFDLLPLSLSCPYCREIISVPWQTKAFQGNKDIVTITKLKEQKERDITIQTICDICYGYVSLTNKVEWFIPFYDDLLGSDLKTAKQYATDDAYSSALSRTKETMKKLDEAKAKREETEEEQSESCLNEVD